MSVEAHGVGRRIVEEVLDTHGAAQLGFLEIVGSEIAHSGVDRGICIEVAAHGEVDRQVERLNHFCDVGISLQRAFHVSIGEEIVDTSRKFQVHRLPLENHSLESNCAFVGRFAFKRHIGVESHLVESGTPVGGSNIRCRDR